MEGHYWVGLNDSEKEGTWVWLNGNEANSSDAALWFRGHPINDDSRKTRDCATSYFRHIYDGFLVYDYSCNAYFRALCEKLVDTEL